MTTQQLQKTIPYGMDIGACTLTLNPALDSTYIFDDEFVVGKTNRTKTPVIVTPGGKGINDTRVLAKLGVTAPAFMPLGGHHGAQFAKLIREEGICAKITEISAQTRCNVKVIDSHNVCTEINPAVEPYDVTEIAQLRMAFMRRCKKSNVVFVGGSLPSGRPNEVYSKIVGDIRSVGNAKIILDTSGEPLRIAVFDSVVKPDLIKPNEEEMCALVGRDLTSIGEFAREATNIFASRGIVVVCTLAERGAILACERGTFHVSSPEGLHVRGFTGAGDTFISTYIYAHFVTKDIETSMRFASSAAARKIELDGSTIPDYEEMGKYFEQVKVARI